MIVGARGARVWSRLPSAVRHARGTRPCTRPADRGSAAIAAANRRRPPSSSPWTAATSLPCPGSGGGPLGQLAVTAGGAVGPKRGMRGAGPVGPGIRRDTRPVARPARRTRFRRRLSRRYDDLDCGRSISVPEGTRSSHTQDDADVTVGARGGPGHYITLRSPTRPRCGVEPRPVMSSAFALRARLPPPARSSRPYQRRRPRHGVK
jgi:hypothetical protein